MPDRVSHGKMWAYVYDGTRVLKTRISLPDLRPHDVLVKIHLVSICGSDSHIVANDDWARETLSPGIVIGHEGGGTVVARGPVVTEIQTGDYVALESHFACPPCEREGKTADQCPHFGIIGIHGTRNGGEDRRLGGTFAEYVAVPAYCCHKINERIRRQVPASLLEPAGNSWEILRYLRGQGLPEHLAIYGCGPHGLNLQLFARYAGIKNIIAFETDPWRLDFARKFGAADSVLNPKEQSPKEIRELTEGRGFDLAVDMVGNISVVEACERYVRDGGRVILFGLPRHEANIAHGANFARIIFNNEVIKMEKYGKQFTLRGFTGRSQKTWEEMIRALETSPLLREKLALPRRCIGSLHELEGVIQNKPAQYLKIGMEAFSV